MRKVALFMIFVASTTLPLASEQAASPGTDNLRLPPGSYQMTCMILDVHGNNLKAICQTLNSVWLTTELHNTDRCIADISNENGRLTCNPNKSQLPRTYLDAFGERAAGLSRRLSQQALLQTSNWQLYHDTWGFKDGAPGEVRALAQTSDGFLWIGGATGLYRFDGRQFELFHSPFGEELLSTNIASLYAPPSGGLWIGYVFGGASFLENGRMKNFGGDFTANSGSIVSVIQDQDGIVWAAGLSSGLWRFDYSHWEHVGREWNIPLHGPRYMALDRDGNLWVGGERMLLRLRRGSRRFEIIEHDLPFDPDLSDDSERLVDREGSIWFANPTGLDRFRYSPVVTSNVPVRTGHGYSVNAISHGAVLIGGWGDGLYRAAPSEMRELREFSGWLIPFIYRAPDTTLWLSSTHNEFGPGTLLWHESHSHQRPIRQPGEPNDILNRREALWRLTGQAWNAIDLPSEIADQGLFLQAITQDRTGGMWVSLGRHGLYRLANGVWTSYGGRKDLPTTGVISEFTDSLNRVWFGCPRNLLAVLDGDRVQVFGPKDGLSVGNITSIYGRGSRIWIGGEFGLEEFYGGQLKSIHAVDDEWLRGISGIVETANGDLWLNGITGIFHIPQSEVAKALKDPSYQVIGDHFGRRDGVLGFASQIRPLPTAIEGTDGRIWFSGTTGVVWIDPAHFENQVTPPPVTIQSVSADDKSYQATPPLKFPAHTSSVQVSYDAISLSNPDAIRFRYKLQETDAEWHEVAKASPVTYRNLPPGRYHFNAAASDTNGVWSDKMASLEFTILPAWYQTLWFRMSAVAGLLGLAVLLYSLRLRRLRHQYNLTLEARVSERTRIARDLHDTMLQSFQAVLLKLHAVTLMIYQHPEEAQETLKTTIEQARGAITEGRDAVQGLRSSTLVTNNLAGALTVLGKELSAEQFMNQAPDFRVLVEGTPRNLTPAVRDNAYRIAGEAVRNAFRHAHARHIEVEIRFDPQQLRLRVRDDGKGIDAEVLGGGRRNGHFGLAGMQERAAQIGGKIEIWSELDSGTEAELTLPAGLAYAKPAEARQRKFMRRGA